MFYTVSFVYNFKPLCFFITGLLPISEKKHSLFQEIKNIIQLCFFVALVTFFLNRSKYVFFVALIAEIGSMFSFLYCLFVRPPWLDFGFFLI